jgi:hypothetical protein
MAMIQKRITTVDSAQPSFSKWWCKGSTHDQRLGLPERAIEAWTPRAIEAASMHVPITRGSLDQYRRYGNG